jgi:hypothetical protein
MTREHALGNRRIGCLAAIALGVAALLFVGVAAVVAVVRNRSEQRQTSTFEQVLPPTTTAVAAPGTLTLDVALAQVVLLPDDAADSNITVRADYDPERYRLVEGTDHEPDGRWTYRLRFEPTGSAAMALLQIKLGGRPPRLYVRVPSRLPIRLDGRFEGGFAAIELGGSSVEAAVLDVEGGALTLSFSRPLTAPMERLSIFGDKGSIEVTGLGHASPRSSRFGQHLGAIDLDLRGAWKRGGDIRIDVGAAGGHVWLPSNIPVERVDPRRRPDPGRAGDEIVPYRLTLSVAEHVGRVVLVDEIAPSSETEGESPERTAPERPSKTQDDAPRPGGT